MADPASLTLNEKAVLLMAGVNVVLDKEEELKAFKKSAKAQLEAACAQAYELLDRYEKGTYDGPISLDLGRILPEDSDMLALRLGDEPLAVRIAQIAQRLMEIDEVKYPDPGREKLEEYTFSGDEAKAMKAEEEATMVKEGWKPDTDKFRDEVRRRVFLRRMMGEKDFKAMEERRLDFKTGKKKAGL
jgi:hypothetical protein